MTDKKVNILIIGSGAAAFAAAKKFRTENSVGEIYVTVPYNLLGDFDFKPVDLTEKNLTELLKFVIDNKIDLTVPISESVLRTDIVSFFEANGQNVFAPVKQICNTLYNRVNEKKLLYKLGIPIPKFAVYNKFQQAKSYLERAKYPLLVQSVYHSQLNDDRIICNTDNAVADFFNYLQQCGEIDVMFEEFVYGNSVTAYYITDGYSVLPITVVNNYKFRSLNCGELTEGMGCYSPCFNLPQKSQIYLNDIANTIIQHFEKQKTPYVGLLGIECILTHENNIVVTHIKPFLQNHDAGVVLTCCEEKFSQVLMSCVNGYFSDEYSQIKTNDFAGVSIVVSGICDNKEIKNIENIIDNIDFINIKKDKDNKYYTLTGECFTLTATKATLSSARRALKEYLSEIDCKDLEYRKDIIQPV